MILATRGFDWCLLALCAVAACARADDEAGNRAYVQASEWGAFYAKSVPAEVYGTKGYTQIFRVVATGSDEPLHRYSWYSPEVFLEGFLGTNDVYVAQLGPSSRGREASADHLAIAFFKNGSLLKAYSTLDIAGKPANVAASESHYQVFGERLGFRRPFGNQLVFDVDDLRGSRLTFDAETGRRLAPGEEQLMGQLDAARTAFQQLRWQWYELKRSRHTDAGQHPITEAELRELSSDSFPSLPSGYEYRPGGVWDPVVLAKGQL
jgi:hypothetical protein